jgi:hypothetical protein
MGDKKREHRDASEALKLLAVIRNNKDRIKNTEKIKVRQEIRIQKEVMGGTSNTEQRLRKGNGRQWTG